MRGSVSKVLWGLCLALVLAAWAPHAAMAADRKDCKDCGFAAEHSWMGWPYCTQHYEERREANRQQAAERHKAATRHCPVCRKEINVNRDSYWYVAGRGIEEFFDTPGHRDERWSCQRCGKPLGDGFQVAVHEVDGMRVCSSCNAGAATWSQGSRPNRASFTPPAGGSSGAAVPAAAAGHTLAPAEDSSIGMPMIVLGGMAGAAILLVIGSIVWSRRFE